MRGVDVLKATVTSEQDGDRARVTFTARGTGRPGIWSPAFGSAMPRLMRPDGPGLWRLEAELPAAANATWAAVSDASAVVPSTRAKLHALTSYRARTRLADLVDAHLSVPEPVTPSLYRLIGVDAGSAVEPNIGVLPTPGAASLDWSVLSAPAPVGERHDVDGRRLVRLGPEAVDEALLLDGEVLQRCASELIATGWRCAFLANLGPVQRFRDHARPFEFARRLSSRLEGAAPAVVVGTSAAAPSALALAGRLGARRAVLLSPAFLHASVRRRLVALAVRTGVHVDLRAGSEETRGSDRSIRSQAKEFAAAVRAAGGSASFREFAGGHDLAAWRVELPDALSEAARTTVESVSGKKES